MIKRNLIFFLRNIKRDKTSFYINLTGLSMGLACVLLIYLWVNDELNMDKFHANDSRLFQVMQNMPSSDGIHTTTATPGVLAHALMDEIPEIEAAAIEYPGRGSKGIISFDNIHINASEMYVSGNYFDVFSYKLLQGNSSQVLADRYSVLLSDELALKLFNTTEGLIGKTVGWDQGNLTDLKGEYVVSGVFEKPGKNSTTQFDVLFAYELLAEKYGSYLGLNSWRGSDPSTYVLLKEGVDVGQLNRKVGDFIRSKFKSTYGDKNLEHIGTLFLQRYSLRYLYNTYENGVPAGGRIAYVRLFSIIAIFILVIACINFMNLSTAKASRRIKEIGIKKTLGSSRRSIAFQFLSESVSMAFLTLPVATVIVVLFLPQFNAITGKQLSLGISLFAAVGIILITLLTGLISGSYPALYLSGFRPLAILKGKTGTVSAGKGTSRLRTGLVIFQFSISVILIVTVLVVYRQVEFIHSKNLGYNKDNVIHFVTKGNILSGGTETFLHELKKIPGVVNAATYQSDIISGERRGVESNVHWDGKAPTDMTQFNYLRVGYDFIETLGVELIEGRSFSRASASDENRVVLNESAIESMGISNPVGKTILVRGAEKTIAGVVRNFHFESFYERIKPALFALRSDGDQVMVRISPGTEKETLDRIGKFYREFNQGLPFEFDFLVEDFKVLYASEQKVADLSRYFAGLAILISCLGLFGLATFIAEQRTKEIGIRKVLGATVSGIAVSLSRDFVKLVLIAIVIASPIAWWAMKKWLQDFAYHIDIEWWMFSGAGLAALLIALLTVSWQAVRAAMANPVESLRNE